MTLTALAAIPGQDYSADEPQWIAFEEDDRVSVDPVDAIAALDWVRALDEEDRIEMFAELRAAISEGRPCDSLVESWRVTAEALEDPLRRAVLLGEFDISDFEDVPRPE